MSFQHVRAKGPASTPAQRVIELQQYLHRIEQELSETQQRLAKYENGVHERDYARWHRMTDTSFGGIPMAQIWADLWLWEAMLNDNPEIQAVFEIGTWKGGFSWWLYAQTLARSIEFFETYDAIEPERQIPGFHRIDVFAESAWLGKRFRAWEPCVVFCDGGNKARELKTFAAELRERDSLLVVHDWDTEILPEQVPGTLEMVYGDLCEEIGSMTRAFRLKHGAEVGIEDA